jgi:HSP20 family protein
VEVEERPRRPVPPEEPEPTPEEEGELTVDIYDKGDTIVIQSTVAGVKPEDLDVSITNDSVTIRGRRERHEEITEDRYYYKELFWGVFSRSVILPEEIDEDAAEASLKHGLLTLRLPKKRRGVVQKLKVKVS